ncbi:Plant calmodulin-binding protein-related [Zea mays]|uniref:Plant calmodulin-binding protein-related n=1 Tax=Zea mays TaxID=4577 RepID=K7V5M6_MAIZE|nr:Plant calmodulin-binding protein-related [Zea mays]
MVLRKPARKKPKDPSAVPAGGPGSRGRSGGMAPAPPAPNYMRATTCSGARSSAAAAPHPQPGREKAVLTAAALRACRATCSSAMKGPGAAGSADACPYAYCSFKGHAHAAAPVPPLGAFVAARRRLIKTQQRMKLKGASPFRNAAAGHGSGYFVEIRAGSDVTSSDLSSDEVGRTEHVVFGPLGCCGGDAEGSGAASVDGSCASSDVISAGSFEPSGTTKHRGLEEKKTLVDHGGEDMGDCRSDISEELDVKHGGNNPQGGVGGGAPKESSVDSVSSSLSGISFEDVSSACAYAAASSQQQNGSSIARRRRTSEQGVKRMRPFKPRLPNFLPSEKVDLKHQSVGDPRAAEEWMLDYALRKEVKKLARAQKRKVEMLVQAFESVMPTLANEKKPEQHDNGDNDKRTFTLAWPSQLVV